MRDALYTDASLYSLCCSSVVEDGWLVAEAGVLGGISDEIEQRVDE
jgi:hypothetical protein